MKTLSVENVIGIVSYLSKEFESESSLRDKAILEKILKNTNRYPENGIWGKAAKLMAEIVRRSPFTTGNPRTAFFVADVFLRMNGFYLRCDNVLTIRFFKALLDENRFTYEHLLPWIKTNAEPL